MLSLENLKKGTPWFIKIPAKIILSRLPIGWHRWQHLNVFRAGNMDAPAEAFAIFRKHFEATGLTGLSGCTVLELGPGNSAITALFAKSFGAVRTWLIDSEQLASQNTALFQQTTQMLSKLGLPAPEIDPSRSVGEVLERLSGTYLTNGLESLKSVPDESVDFLFSNAVLEHVRLGEFAGTIQEMRRVLKPAGVASHQIDFRDHLQDGLNNLRFSERVWESTFMVRSGFYTNRIPWPAMRTMFEEGGFCVELRSSRRWPRGLPTLQKSMSPPFRNLAEEDLMTMDAHVVLRWQ
ncbi:MAG TPA: class I SAM-dependent methyltransferase [Candidatus Angelobacter sp.]